MKSHFPIFNHQSGLIYLDSAATSLKPQSVIDAVAAYLGEYSSNTGRGLYPLAERATEAYEAVRLQTARFLQASPEEIVFTKNTTDSINMFARMIEDRIEAENNIVTTLLEHHSNFLPWKELAARTRADFRIAPFTDRGFIDTDALVGCVDDQTALVAFSAISNVTGAINDVPAIVAALRRKNPRLIILIDAAQAAAHIPIDVASWGADAIAFSGHKMFGPTGVGILWVRQALLKTFRPVSFGGGMVTDACAQKTEYREAPFCFEAGTPDIASVIGFGAALRFIDTIGIAAIREHEQELIRYATKKLEGAFGTKLKLLGPTDAAERIGLISFTLDGIHPHDLAHLLGEQNICLRAGEHCAAPLHRKLNLPATTRISFGIYNTEEDIDRLIEAIKNTLLILKK